MIKANMIAVVSNRGRKEVGVVQKRFKRKGVVYYNIYLERGHLMENVTEDIEKPFHILIELSEKLNKRKNEIRRPAE